jgi:hypothetical protein
LQREKFHWVMKRLIKLIEESERRFFCWILKWTILLNLSFRKPSRNWTFQEIDEILPKSYEIFFDFWTFDSFSVALQKHYEVFVGGSTVSISNYVIEKILNIIWSQTTFDSSFQIFLWFDSITNIWTHLHSFLSRSCEKYVWNFRFGWIIPLHWTCSGDQSPRHSSSN